MVRKYFAMLTVFLCLLTAAFGSAAFGDEIIDNGAPGTSSTGTWQASGAADPYGSESLWSRDGATYTWTFTPATTGTYEISMWWTVYSSRSDNVPVDIEFSGGTDTRRINQKINGKQWNVIASYPFVGGQRYDITITSPPHPYSTCADAVKFALVPPAGNTTNGVVIDNGNQGTSSTGTWQASGATGPYGPTSLWSRDGATYSWTFTPAETKNYEVSMWWTEYSSRSDGVPVDIQHDAGSGRRVINQQDNGGQWNLLGTYAFTAGKKYTVKMTSQPGPSSTCADAVRFVPAASSGGQGTAPALTTQPANQSVSVGATATFGVAAAGTTPINYQWQKNGVNIAGATAGFYTTPATTQNDDGTLFRCVATNAWGSVTSNAARLTVTAGSANDGNDGMVFDDGNQGTSSTGTWQASGATGSYGSKSLWARDGATYSWSFTPPTSGNYEVSMWWTEYSSRSDSVPVDIQHDAGSGRRVINQQDNGGQWNSLGTYAFTAGKKYSVKITSQPGPSSTCADAVKFAFIDAGGGNGGGDGGGDGGGSSSSVAIDSVSPDPGVFGAPVTMTGRPNTPDNQISAYEWTSDRDGTIGNSRVLTTATLSSGSHTLSFRVRNTSGVWSSPATRKIDVVEHLYVCLIYTSFRNARDEFVSLMKSMGARETAYNLYEYQNAKTGAKFMLHVVQDKQGMINALKTEGAHVLVKGHSNYGSGPSFGSTEEVRRQIIENIYYVDDDRFLKVSTPWINVSLSGLRTGQAYPYYWPIFKNGTSALMPYNFGDSRGNPAYNYYISYQVPGNSNTWYKVQTTRGGAIQRFYDSGRPAWFSSSGAEPNPSTNSGYFITNTAPDPPSIEVSGNWAEDYRISSQFRENYTYTNAGNGSEEFQWLFTIPSAGTYSVYAWWPTYSGNSASVPYTVYSSDGATVKNVNQKSNGGKWNKLGDFEYDAGEYSIAVSNDAGSGRVMADAVRVVAADNPPAVIKANFYAENRHGQAPLEVDFDSESTGDITSFVWNFGDGSPTNNTRTYLTHTYTKPGNYTVSLKVNGPAGSNTVTRTAYIVVTPSSSPAGAAPLQAEFSSDNHVGTVPFETIFNDMSSGNISEWNWDFGDGSTSRQKTPKHTYRKTGNHTVKLTVTDASGTSNTVTKSNYVIAANMDESIDNVDYPKPHYRSKNILFRKALEVPKQEMKYRRLLYDSCNSGNYYLGTFNRGLVYYTLNNSSTLGFFPYIRGYMEGLSDHRLWEIMQAAQPIYDYYNFNLLPGQQDK